MAHVRHEILQLRDQENLTEREIALRLELSPSTVHYWLSKGVHPLPPSRRGRKRKTTPIQEKVLEHYSLEDPFRTAVEIRNALVPHLSADTVRRRLREKGLKSRIAARKPFLRPIHLELRFSYARSHVHWGHEEWDRVIFSDEKIFRAGLNGPLRVYRPTDHGNRYEARYMLSKSSSLKGNFTINVWMGFGKKFRVVHWVRRKTLNAAYYTEHILPLIRDFVVTLPDEDMVFMHDLSAIHTAHLTSHWLEAHNIEVMSDWAPKGADMNPVENIWGYMARHLPNDLSSREHLFEEVYMLFQGLKEDYFNKLIESMPRRVDLVVKAEGGWTRY